MTSVQIVEVGPRDGLQNEGALVPTEVKADFCRRLLAAGLPVVESWTDPAGDFALTLCRR